GDAIRRFSTFMTFFSSADLLEIGDIPFRSAGFRPTRSKAVRYLSAAAQHNSLEIRPHTLVKRGRSAEVKFAVEASGRVFQVAPRDHRNRIR
ncbi:MAG: NAD(P)-binding domain-containing protein, partial [Proteobacteria bacterium]|nr:NAD(P)-binding domain-containing protein [Pseudomonadota bacterium]